MSAEAWPYDADEHDPLTALRIPVASSHPRWIYLVAFDRDSAARPTEAEMGALASYIDYQREWFNKTWQAKLLQRPFDIEGGHNTTIFHKYGEDDWAYRKRTWIYGPRFWPSYNRTEKVALVGVMDHNHTFGDHMIERWVNWKADHPDVFEVPA